MMALPMNTVERLDLLDEMLGELDRVIDGQDQAITAMVEAPGVTEEQVGNFTEAERIRALYRPGD